MFHGVFAAWKAARTEIIFDYANIDVSHHVASIFHPIDTSFVCVDIWFNIQAEQWDFHKLIDCRHFSGNSVQRNEGEQRVKKRMNEQSSINVAGQMSTGFTPIKPVFNKRPLLLYLLPKILCHLGAFWIIYRSQSKSVRHFSKSWRSLFDFIISQINQSQCARNWVDGLRYIIRS